MHRDAFCLFYDAKDKTVKALNGSGRAPAKLTIDYAISRGMKGRIPLTDLNSVTVPGWSMTFCLVKKVINEVNRCCRGLDWYPRNLWQWSCINCRCFWTRHPFGWRRVCMRKIEVWLPMLISVKGAGFWNSWVGGMCIYLVILTRVIEHLCLVSGNVPRYVFRYVAYPSLSLQFRSWSRTHHLMAMRCFWMGRRHYQDRSFSSLT